MTDLEELLTEVNAVEQMHHQLHMGMIAKLLEQRQVIAEKPIEYRPREFGDVLIEDCRMIAKYKVVPKGSTVEVTSKFYEAAIYIAQTVLGIAGVKPNEDENNKGGDGRSSDGSVRQEGAYGFAADRANPQQSDGRSGEDSGGSDEPLTDAGAVHEE